MKKPDVSCVNEETLGGGCLQKDNIAEPRLFREVEASQSATCCIVWTCMSSHSDNGPQVCCPACRTWSDGCHITPHLTPNKARSGGGGCVFLVCCILTSTNIFACQESFCVSQEALNNTFQLRQVCFFKVTCVFSHCMTHISSQTWSDTSLKE